MVYTQGAGGVGQLTAGHEIVGASMDIIYV